METLDSTPMPESVPVDWNISQDVSSNLPAVNENTVFSHTTALHDSSFKILFEHLYNSLHDNNRLI